MPLSVKGLFALISIHNIVNNTQHNNTAVILSVAFCYAERHYSECRYSECRGGPVIVQLFSYFSNLTIKLQLLPCSRVFLLR